MSGPSAIQSARLTFLFTDRDDASLALAAARFSLSETLPNARISHAEVREIEPGTFFVELEGHV